MGEAMTKPTQNERIAIEMRAFSESFEQNVTTLKTDEQVGAACLELALGRERIRRDVKTQGPNQDAVDYETLEVLRNAQLDDPQFVEAEAIFRRLATDPVLAGRYYEKLIIKKAADLSVKQKKRAQKRRPRARTQLSLLIDEIVLENPDISKDELEVELLTHEGIEIIDEELRDTNNAETIKISALKDQLTRAKKNSRQPG
jgi:hypothetical protein